MGDYVVELSTFEQVIAFLGQPFQFCCAFSDLLEQLSGE